MLLNRARRFLDPNPAPAGAPPAAPPAPAQAPAQKRRPITLPSRAEAGFQSLVIQYGGEDNAVNLARYLYDENHSFRNKLKEARDQITGWETRNPQGSIVLHGQDLADYNAWKALGKPAEIKAQLEQAATTKAALDEANRKTALTAAAKAVGFGALALEDRLGAAKLELQVVEETAADGTKKQIPKVRKAGVESAPWEALEVVATRDWTPEHIAALKAAGAAGGSNAGDPIIPFPNNGASGGSGAQSAVSTFIKKTAEAAAQAQNPLLPQGARTGTK
jgi:hypothetical protein